MKKQLLIYALAGGALITLLQVVDYNYFIHRYSMEIYGGLVAVIFTGLGIYFGLKLTRKKVVVKEVEVSKSFTLNEKKLKDLEITQRELEILQQMALGLSNREIGERLFVSENTVKTHSSRLFEKLDARRRTEAVKKAKEWGLIG